MWRPNQTALIYSAALWLASGLMALVLHLVPMLSQGGIPPYSWPLLFGFLIEAALRPRIDRGDWPPLLMRWRFLAVCGAVFILAGALQILQNAPILAPILHNAVE